MPILAGLMLTTLVAEPANGFWFYCKMRDAARAAKVAAAARARYLGYVSDPRATQQQTRVCKAAWDNLRGATFGKIKEFAGSVPNTSITGPSNLKDLIKQAIKELIKETLGNVSAKAFEGTPDASMAGLAGEFSHPDGEFFASPVFASIPVGDVSVGMISSVRLAYLAPEDYDGSDGRALFGFQELETPLILLSGDFAGVPIAAFGVDSINPDAGAFGGVTVTPGDLAALIAADGPFENGFDGGAASDALMAWVVAQGFPWDPFGHLRPGLPQASTIEITGIDPVAGTLSGSFFSVIGETKLWDNGHFDGGFGLPSSIGTGDPESRTADDFVLAQGNGRPYEIRSITAELLQTSDPFVNAAVVEIYPDSGAGRPADGPPLAVFQADFSVIVDNASGLPVHRYVFETPGLMLDPGAYWVAAIGLGDGSGVDQALFATAGAGAVQLNEGYFRSGAAGFPDWTPVSTVAGAPIDFAFCVEAELQTQCPADLNEDGVVNVLDFFEFVSLFAARDPGADINGDGAVNVLDFFAFITAFAEGCG